MSNQILPNTTLAAIVRDEEDNPAHGVEAWLRASLPYVERAIVVDTGSVDRTRKILEELKINYPHLQVFDRKFDDFASSRNFSLEKVKTKRALVLDADELLLPDEYERINDYIREISRKRYHFSFRQIYPNGTSYNTFENLQTCRLFDVEGIEFKNLLRIGCCESIREAKPKKKDYILIPSEIAIIKHFLPDEEAVKNKIKFWYEKGEFLNNIPLEHAGKYGWKERNTERNSYFGLKSSSREH